MKILAEVADAGGTMTRAKQALASAGGDKHTVRLSAEAAYLAVCQAADVVAAEYGFTEPMGYRGRIEALNSFDTDEKTTTVNDFITVGILLHGECYHEGRCAEVDAGFEAAERLVEEVGDHINYGALPTPSGRPKPGRRKRRR